MNKNTLSTSINSSLKDDIKNTHATSDTLPSGVKSALFHPQMSLEVRGWLKNNQSTANKWRGEFGESMMHWAFLSDWTLAMELREVGLDLNHLDNDNRSPMDWLLDRLYSSIVDESTNHHLSAGGKERLLKQSINQFQYLWPLNARPSDKNQSLHPGVVWIRSGAWELLDLLNEVDQDFSSWFKWLPYEGNALHAWILSFESHKKSNFLDNWIKYGLDIDARDNNGRSPLWYAIDGFIVSPSHRALLLKSINSLLEKGSDPLADDINGATPYSVAKTHLEEISEKLQIMNDDDKSNKEEDENKEREGLILLQSQLKEIVDKMNVEQDDWK